jgi:hypothetical protein
MSNSLKRIVHFFSVFALLLTGGLPALAGAAAGVPGKDAPAAPLAGAINLDMLLGWDGVLVLSVAALILLAFWVVVHRADRVEAWLEGAADQVPLPVIKLLLLALSVFATIWPEVLLSSHAGALALGASVVNLLLLGDIAANHPAVAIRMDDWLRMGLPASVAAGAWLALYFGVLAVCHASVVSGIFAVAAFSVLLSAGCYYVLGAWVEKRCEPVQAAVVAMHLALLALYLGASRLGIIPGTLEVFAGGFQLYVPTALCFGCLRTLAVKDALPVGELRRSTSFWAGVGTLAVLVAVCLLLGQNLVGAVLSCWAALGVLSWFIKRLGTRL